MYVSHERVEVRCPMRASQREVREFVQKNHDWINERLREEAELAGQCMLLEHGGRIFYQSRELTVVFRESDEQRVRVTDKQFIMQGHRLTPDKARRMLSEYLIQQANAYLPPRVQALAKHLDVAHKIKKITLRKTKSKWGHCTEEGVIQFNWLLMLTPYSIIDYLITHEVCHLIHMDHSRRYWRLVHSLCPDTKRYVHWLKENEHRLWF